MKPKQSKADLWRSFGLERPPSPRYTSPEEKGIAWEKLRRVLHNEEKDCYTCPKKNLVKNGYKADCGHYKPVAIVGSNNKRSWDRRFVHLQCSYCNGAGQGMAVEFRRHLVADYGEELVEEFDNNYRQIAPIKNWRLLIAHYESLM